ncbi:hypothetical protein BC832DRAFT_88782 [Gaertneriomyces semiglobifer]|nr:hypothetical protein BC832DRAFT_88782 [Gaertneriomyces semiglobifer]
MQASKLSATQQRFLDQFLKVGTPLPPNPTPGMSFYPDDNDAQPMMIPFNYAPLKRAPIPMYGRRPQIRTLDTIVAGGAFDIEAYRPTPTKDRNAEKQRFQKLMATGGAHASPAAEAEDEEDEQDDIGRPTKRGGGRRGRRPEPEEVLDEFGMIMEEIQERRQWLDDMIALGHGKEHTREIQTEISERIRRLKQIDAERSKANDLTRTRKA